MWDIHEAIGEVHVGTMVLTLHCYSRDKIHTSFKVLVLNEARTCGLKKASWYQTTCIKNFYIYSAIT